MKATLLFPYRKTNEISPTFGGDALITGFNLRPYSNIKDANGVIIAEDCGDYVYFEELLFDSEYDVSCGMRVIEDSAILSEPLKDECGNLIVINSCKNYVYITKPGIFRAIYVGGGRADAAVTYVPM